MQSEADIMGEQISFVLEIDESGAAANEKITVRPLRTLVPHTRGWRDAHVDVVFSPYPSQPLEKPYVRTSTRATILHLKKFLAKKLDLPRPEDVDILCRGEASREPRVPLPIGPGS